MTLKSFNVWVIYQIIHDTLEHSMLIFFLTLESLNAEIYASFDTFALRCHNKRLFISLIVSGRYPENTAI